MTKAEKKTLKLPAEKPQYITVNDITYAQVDPGSDIAGGI